MTASLVYPDVSGRRATYEGLVLSSNPAAYWPLQETNGTVAIDLGSGGNDGSYVSTPTLGQQPGPIARVAGVSRAVEFDGTNYVDSGVETVGSTGLFCDGGESFTVAAWMKVARADSGTIVARAAAANRTFQVFWAAANDSIRVQLRGTQTEVAVTPRDGNTWQHVAVTWDTSTAKLFFDGAFASNLNVGAAAENAGQRIIVGARTNGTAFRLTGQISHVTIWDTDLGAEEINALYPCGLNGQ